MILWTLVSWTLMLWTSSFILVYCRSANDEFLKRKFLMWIMNIYYYIMVSRFTEKHQPTWVRLCLDNWVIKSLKYNQDNFVFFFFLIIFKCFKTFEKEKIKGKIKNPSSDQRRGSYSIFVILLQMHSAIGCTTLTVWNHKSYPMIIK